MGAVRAYRRAWMTPPESAYVADRKMRKMKMTELLERVAEKLETMFNDVKRFEPFDISAAKDGMINTQFPFGGLTVTVGIMTKDGKTKVKRNQAKWERVVSIGNTYYTF